MAVHKNYYSWGIINFVVSFVIFFGFFLSDIKPLFVGKERDLPVAPGGYLYLVNDFVKD